MANFVNSFALLDDDVEDDDVEALFNRIVNKAFDSLMLAHNEDETSARNGSGGRKGGKGHWVGSRDDRNGWDDDIQGGDALEWNHNRDSYGSGDAVGDGKSLDWGQGHGKDSGGENGWGDDVNEAFGGENGWGDDVNEAFGGENGWGNVNEASGGENGWGNVNEASGSGDSNIQTVNDDAGWQEVSKSQGKGYADNDRAFGVEHGYKNGNDVEEKRGYGDQVQYNGAADGQRQYRNGNQRYGGERRGYVNQGQGNNAADGRRYRNGRRGYDGERRGHEDKVQDNNANSERHSMEVDVSEDNRAGGEERKYRNGNQNYGGEKRGYGRNRERGGQDYRRTDSDEGKETVNADDGHDFRAVHVNGSGGDADLIWEASKAAEVEEHNITEEVSEDTRVPKEDTEEQKKKTELELKKKEEEMKEAALMTLDQYEKLLLEKKQALNLQKTELRKVSIDKELEGMRLIEKKPVAINDIWKSAKDKQKMKNSPKNQASETSKTEDNGEVTESDVNLISEEEKLQKDGSLEKKEKSRKFVAVEVHEIFKPTFHRRSSGGRGQSRGGRGEQGGFSDRTNSDAAARTPARTPASRHPRIPMDKDFPVLGATLPAPVKHSA